MVGSADAGVVTELADDVPVTELPRVRRELARGGTASGLLKSLEAEVLAALGRPGEANEAARAALRWLDDNRTEDMTARAHEPMVRGRLAKIPSPGRTARPL